MTKNLTVKQLAVVTGVAALVLLAVWYTALLKPQSHKLASARKADAAAQVQISGLRQQTSQLQQLEKQIPADKTKLARYQQAIPSAPELSSAIRSIQAAANSAGVSITSLAPTVATSSASTKPGPGSASGAKSVPVTIAASGDFANITSFLQALSSMPRTLVIQSTAMSGTGSGLTLSISAAMFYTGS